MGVALSDSTVNLGMFAEVTWQFFHFWLPEITNISRVFKIVISRNSNYDLASDDFFEGVANYHLDCCQKIIFDREV